MFIDKLVRRSAIAPGLIVMAAVSFLFAQAWAVEPQMSSYTSYPIFISSSVTPNVMIILDNSGSMNEAAYPVGDPYKEMGVHTVRAADSLDDTEELWDFGTQGSSYSYSNDLDIGALNADGSQKILIGIRFPQAGIPKGSTITKAEIRFKALGNNGSGASFTIVGIKQTNTGQFLPNSYAPTDGSYDVKNRPETTASLTWTPVAWSNGVTYPTSDLKTIVQELVNQNGWDTSSAVGFKIKPGSGKRDAYAADNGESEEPKLYVEFTPPPGNGHGYYGYFDPTARYNYASNKFSRAANGTWSGDWLNWVCMRKVDVVRKVMMGGLATARTGGGNQVNYGEDPNDTSRRFDKTYTDDTIAGRSNNPYTGTKTWRVQEGYLEERNSGARYTIAVQKDATAEPQDFKDGNLVGVLQRVGDQVRWGNMWFYTGTGTGQEGGRVSNAIGANITTLVTDLQNTAANTWTPLAETYYVCARYFMQTKPESSLGYSNSAIGAINNTMDPYYDTDFLSCAKSFAILLTDGASTKDSKIPTTLKDFDGDGDRTNCTEDSCEYPSAGSDYLDDVALWARTTDLRPEGSSKALEGEQNIILYTVYAFGNDPNAQQLLKDAARNGGFEDENGNDRPDLTREWDKKGAIDPITGVNGPDGIPDTYFEASDGYLLEKQLMAAITDILKRASSATAVSVLATSAEGEGTIVQAFFKPAVTESTGDVTWVGYLQSLWVDSLGRMREDTPPQGAEPGLDVKTDRIVEFYYDEDTGGARFKRFLLDAEGDKQVIFTDENGNGVLDPWEDFIDVNGNGTWDDAETFDDANHNGVLDLGEPYSDLNGDGVWTEGDTYTDANVNGRWDDDEPFIDINGDGACCAPAETWIENPAYTAGVYDLPEPFVDNNMNGVWDSAEPWTELGGDPNAYDEGIDTFIVCGGGLSYAAQTCHDRDGDGIWNPAEDFSDVTDVGYTPGYDPGDSCVVHDWNDNGVWDEGEPFIDDVGGALPGYYDAGDTFNADTSCDTNLNGQYDGPETFTDLNLNGAWDQAETFVDVNGNGMYDDPEPFVDEDGNGTWSDGEAYTDANGNGRYDYAESFNDANGNGVWDDGEPWHFVYTEHNMDELRPIWEAGSKLAARSAASRTVKTFIDLNANGVVDANEYIDFTAANSSAIQPFLGVAPDADYNYLGATHTDRTNNLINFIRGEGSGFTGTPRLRNRTLGGNVWKLGDIIYSTPVTIGRPLDNFDLIYGDRTFLEFFRDNEDREQMVYVGANDGMLHAFLMGRQNSRDNPDTTLISESIYLDKLATTTEGIGDELWAYVPQALLPHLKWLANPDYTHVYYVDLKPRVVSAQLWTSTDPDHKEGWGTVLIGGLNYGGKEIWSTSTFADGTTNRTFRSCFFAIDITDPHDPQLMWERTFPTIGLTTAPPTVVKLNDKWFTVFGSGPTDYAGTSSQQPHVFVVDMLTGELKRDETIPVNNAFMGAGPITVDLGLNFSADVGYIGLVYQQGSTWLGKMYRMYFPKTSSSGSDGWRVPSSGDVYNTNPTSWEFKRLLDVQGPVTAPPSASIDAVDNLWIYFGTGRFFADADKSDTNAQYFYGIKDPYYAHKADRTFKYATKGAADAATSFNLLNSTPIQVFTDETVTGHPTAAVDTWTELVADMRGRDGWSLTLGQTAGFQGERVLNKPTVLGGIVFDTTYIPNVDPCGYGGNSSIVGLYYETGTAFTDEIFLGGSTEVTVGGETKRRVSRSMNLGVGSGSSVSIHVGKQRPGDPSGSGGSVTGFVQQSTGIVKDLAINPAFSVRSGFVFWREH